MTPIAAHLFDETEIPAVCAEDLGAGLALWLARERQGIFLVAGEAVATPGSIDRAVIDMSGHPSQGIAVLFRMRCLVAALTSLRFKYLTRPEHAGHLACLVEIASDMRLNARYGLSPVRLAWALKAAAKAGASEVRDAA